MMILRKKKMSKIDVSKCKCEYKYKDNCCLFEDECKYITDCHYKQLQKYKNTLDEIEEILNSYCENMCYGCSDDCVTKEVLELIKQAKKGRNNG